jgi:uncharacterized protein (DUF169 family)
VVGIDGEGDNRMTHRQMAEKLTGALGLSEAPIAVYYTDHKIEGAFMWNCMGDHFCSIGRMAAVRKGTPMVIDGENAGCGGAAFFLGYQNSIRPGFEYFLAHDDKGKGERFKKTPELARTLMDSFQFVPASGPYCVFQRLSDIPDGVTPEVVSIFADGDGIGGLVTLANYGRRGKDAVIAPQTAGCGSLVNEARAQALQPEPRAVLGMFDPAARPRMEKNYLTFSVPWPMFVEMVGNLPGSFVEIDPWVSMKDR